MDAKTKRELNALLAFIGNKKLELSQSLPFLYFPIGDKAGSREYQPLNNGAEEGNQSIKPEEIIRYTNGLVLEQFDGSYKYIDITDYWERLSQRFGTLSLYIAKAMGPHWFLLYYVHRFCLTWRGRSIVVEKPAVASIKRIDAIISSISYTQGEVGRDQVQDIVDFAAKVVGNLDITKITELYFEDADAFDADNRLAKLESFIKTLPPDDSIELCEVLDSISFVLKYGGYWGARELYRIYFYSAPPSYKCLCLNNEHFPDYYKAISEELPNVILPFFNNVEELLDGIRKEYGDQKLIFDGDVQTIVDELLAQSPTMEEEAGWQLGTCSTTKTLHKGRTSGTWLINQYALLTEDEARGALLDSRIWYDLDQMIRNRCIFPKGMDNGNNKDSIVRGICAGLIYYAAENCHIAIPSVANIPKSFERTLVFNEKEGTLSPRSSITKYYIMLRDWYPKYNPANRSSEEQSKYISEWLKSDKVRCEFLITPGNYAQFQKCLEFLSTELNKSFDEVLKRKLEQTKSKLDGKY